MYAESLHGQMHGWLAFVPFMIRNNKMKGRKTSMYNTGELRKGRGSGGDDASRVWERKEGE